MTRAERWSVLAFMRWTEEGRSREYWLALVATTAAILAKLSAAHIGVLFAGVYLKRFGLQRAANSSYYLFWTGRLGFTLHEAEQRLDKLKEFRRRGAAYVIAERNILLAEPDFEQQVRERFPVLAEGEHAVLFELRQETSASSTPINGDDDV